MNYTRVFVALTALVVGGCSALPAGAGAAPDAARESAAAAATNVASPSSAEPSEASAPAGAVGEIAAGCEPSALGALHDDGFVPIEDRRTTPVEQQID